MSKIAVIGAGPAGISFLRAVANELGIEETKRNDIHITLYEKHTKVVGGRPYSSAFNYRSSLTNMPIQEMSVLGRHNSLENWILYNNLGLEGYPTRVAFGAYLASQCQHAVKDLRRLGVKVDIVYNVPQELDRRIR